MPERIEAQELIVVNFSMIPMSARKWILETRPKRHLPGDRARLGRSRVRLAPDT